MKKILFFSATVMILFFNSCQTRTSCEQQGGVWDVITGTCNPNGGGTGVGVGNGDNNRIESTFAATITFNSLTSSGFEEKVVDINGDGIADAGDGDQIDHNFSKVGCFDANGNFFYAVFNLNMKTQMENVARNAFNKTVTVVVQYSYTPNRPYGVDVDPRTVKAPYAMINGGQGIYGYVESVI